jgi:hypothetical protein
MRLALATPASASATTTSAVAGRHFVHVADLPEPPLGAAHPANALTTTPSAAAIGSQLYGVSDWNAPTDLHEAGLIGGTLCVFLLGQWSNLFSSSACVCKLFSLTLIHVFALFVFLVTFFDWPQRDRRCVAPS